MGQTHEDYLKMLNRLFQIGKTITVVVIFDFLRASGNFYVVCEGAKIDRLR